MKADFKSGIKTCTSCRLPKKLIFFSIDIYRSDGYDIYCKVCRNAKAKKRRKFKDFDEVIVSAVDKKQQKINNFNDRLKAVWNNLNLSN